MGGWDDIKSNKFFKAGVSGNLFNQIQGRELEPPLHPAGQAYSEQAPQQCTDSDKEELGVDDPSDIGVRICTAFKSFDLNGDCVIDKSEMTAVLSAISAEKFTPDVIDKLFAAVDTDGNGSVDYEEFIQWMFAEEQQEILEALRTELEIH